MKKRLLFTMILSLFVFAAPAQDSIAHRQIHYFFQLNNGLMVGKGSDAVSSTINTIQGITLGKKFRVGGGIGLDIYDEWQTLPLFGSASYDVLRLKNVSPFVQVNYGWAHAWKKKNDTGITTDDQGGKMFMAMTGVRINLGKANLCIAGGYKFQSVVSNYGYSNINPLATGTIYPGDGYSQRNFRTMERFVITLGVGWK